MEPPDAITRQRWFRAKARTVASVRTVDAAPLTDAIRLTVVEVGYADGPGRDRYLVPLAGDVEPADGDGAWRAMLAAMATGREVAGSAGRFRFDATPALAELLPSAAEAVAALDERRLRVEQSNTSVVLGERLILKLFRLLEPGRNPDLEIGAFLGRVGFDGAPALCGSATYHPSDGEPCAAAILQAFVPATGDGWTAMLGHLADDPAAGVRAAAEIGLLTRRLHDALASRPDEPGFPARAATSADTGAWRASAEAQLAQAIGSVSGEAHERLVRAAPLVRERFADAFGRATGDERVTRIHGDYHLGQLLATDRGFMVIDFEGEPARPLAERRAPTSPLRDVAGMLRSIDYAARTAERGDPAPGFAAERWLPAARDAFLGACGDIGQLVEAFELEKACYEIRYEANNRPDWLWLPLEALERVATG
jgi:maltose alpha-D-glucosyltransferase/alpha-amylase